MIIGVTGQTGAGKTTLLRWLEAKGYTVVDCDEVYHRLFDGDEALRGAIMSEFGTLERKKLANVVFSDRERLKKLNEITHPAVLDEVKRLISGKRNAAIDAVELFEGGEAALCDRIIAVTAPREIRIERIMRRDGIDRAYAEARVDGQKSETWYREKSGLVIENNFGSEAELSAFLDNVIGKEIDIMEEKKNDLRDELFYNQKHLADTLSEEEKKASDAYAENYKAFLAAARTERLAVKEAVRQAEKVGFKAWNGKDALKPGDKIYRSLRGKALILAVMGKKPMEEGTHICAAHIDSPRLDLKEVPLMERDEVAYLKTHYYGGIRKYQWLCIPLAIHGVVIKKDGEAVEISIGDDKNDPTFVITDLLPHLAAKQSQQPLGQAIPGENLNLIIGSLPYGEEGGDRIKLGVMKLMNEKYGITETDFLSAELEVTPALEPRDVGFDRSLIASYGHDDRVCAYAELKAIYETENPEYTAICILADKEEIGSVGVTGMQSRAFENFMEDLCRNDGSILRHCFANTLCISADVTNAYDPMYPEVSDKMNNTRLNYGVGICKYTGSRGKGGASDAAAETVGKVRRIFAEDGVVWQTGELGKVDEGGGGTVAAYMANRDIETIDAGTPVLAMHSPFEIVSKYDCYMTYRAMKAAYKSEII